MSAAPAIACDLTPAGGTLIAHAGTLPAPCAMTPAPSAGVPEFLVVEDDDDDFFLVQELLRSELGAPVEQARSVDEALERTAARDYSLILLDYSLGAKNGLDLLAQLRALDTVTPVIFLTGHGDEQLAVRALKGGAVDYLAKANLSRETLGSAVRHALALRERDAAVREARDALAARERDYRTLFEKASDAILILDPQTEIILEANAAASRLYAVEHEQLVGRSLIEFSTDVVRGRQAVDGCIAGGELANFATVHISGDGRRIDILASASVLEYRGQTTILTLCRDITEQKKAADQLRESEQHLRNLIETANEGIWTIDAEERTTFVNAKMAAMLGWTPEEMLGRDVKEFNDPSQHALLASSIAERRHMGRGHYEVILLRKDGSRIITSLNSSPILNAEGNYAGALAMITDITDQKRAEEKLVASERRYRTLFERNLAGVFRATAEGAVLEANEAFTRMLGYDSAAELRALKLPQLCAAAGCTERWYEKLMTTRQLVNQEISVLRKDGKTAYLLANLVTHGDVIEGTVLDITERRQLEAQLLQSQKMDAIGQLAGGIAHDFNNLLMVIRSYAEMAGEAVADDAVKRQLESIIKAADRGASLTRQLLTFGRKQMFAPRVIELNSVLDNMTKVLPRALGEDVRVELHAAPELWPVKADPVQIEQLLLNLAVNARDAMPSGGRLTLETANVVLDSNYVKIHAGVMPGDYVMLAVSDTGQGIAPDVLPRIFEPFFTTKERGKGTGLGLATVYGIVRQCGGFVWVYSEVGHGTVFKIYLPRVDAQGTADKAQGTSPDQVPSVASSSPLAGRTCTETILVVEDEEAVRCATRDYLARRGYRVFEAGSGEEALRHSELHSGEIDLLITDAVMPGMSGAELARKMAERRPGIRILCISGYTEASMGAHGLNTDTAFLQKPFSLAALEKKVREVLEAAA